MSTINKVTRRYTDINLIYSKEVLHIPKIYAFLKLLHNILYAFSVDAQILYHGKDLYQGLLMVMVWYVVLILAINRHRFSFVNFSPSTSRLLYNCNKSLIFNITLIIIINVLSYTI